MFQQIIEFIERPEKSDESLTTKIFDNNSDKVKQTIRLPINFPSYIYYRGNLEIFDNKSFFYSNPTFVNIKEKNYRPSIRNQRAQYKLLQELGGARGLCVHSIQF